MNINFSIVNLLNKSIIVKLNNTEVYQLYPIPFASPSEGSRNKFIITGGPGFGITTIIDTLAQLGIQTKREAARYIINRESQLDSIALPWKDRDAFDRLLCQQKVSDYYTDTHNKPLFFDRALPDFVGWREHLNMQVTEFMADIRQHPYEKNVFMTVPWKEIYERNETRPITFTESESIYHHLLKGYQKLGYLVTQIPKASPMERACFVMDTLHIKPSLSLDQL